MDETKRTNFGVSFPNSGLSPEQELELKEALKSAVVAVLTEQIKSQVNVQQKVNDWAEDRATK
jgi:hypothetical protein